MIKVDEYKYLRQDIPKLQDRRQYCQKLIATAIKNSKNSQLFCPIPIRLQPSKNTKYDQIFKSMIIDNDVSGVLYIQVRKRVKLNKVQSLYLYCGDLLVNYLSDLKTLYDKKKQPDGFLYITYGQVNTF